MKRIYMICATFLVSLSLMFSYGCAYNQPIQPDSHNSYNTNAAPEISTHTIPDNFYETTPGAIFDKNISLSPGEVQYDPLDSQGRTGQVRARLNKTSLIKGKSERKNMSHIHPSGLKDNKQVDITFADGQTYHGFFYNRSHLLAHQLGGDEIEQNIICGTRPQNVGKNDTKGGMQYIEQKTVNYLKDNPDAEVTYVATPIYVHEDDIVPQYVYVDVKSKDATLDEHVVVYNCAPGFSIDYKTGAYTHE